jgi:Cu2+-exporting ATPase
VNGAAHVAASSADMILLSHDLRVLVTGVCTARRTQTIVRQNLLWAVVYNVLAIPAAAMGIVTPWMAALGMSASSLFVVLNALRLTRSSRRTPPLSDTAQHAAPPTLLAASE